MTDILIKLIFDGNTIIMQCKSDEYMKDIFKRFATKVEKNVGEIYFLYGGDIVSNEAKLSKYLVKDKGFEDKEIVIIVNEYGDEDKELLKISKDIICPTCKEICMLSFKDYKICLDNCINKHFFKNILIEQFNEFQKKSKLLCNNNNCENNKKESFDEQFYKCCNCKINICPICKLNHNKEHIIIDYDQKNYICNEHGEKNEMYCNECYQNFCKLCKSNDKHKFIPFNTILKKEENNINEIRNKINNLKEEVKEITKKFNKVINNLEAYYDATNTIINNYNENKKNYQILKSINNIYDYNKKNNE